MTRLVRVCSFLVALSFVFPFFVFAEDMEADQQCPAGGTVGQKCKDSTNGYVTSGHCTHIHVCKADSWNKNPPTGCGSSGNIYAPTADCPKGPVIPNGTNPPISTGTSANSFPDVASSSHGAFSSNLFDQAFFGGDQNFYLPSNTVSTTSIDGIEYFISGNEKLPAGSALTLEPPPPAVRGGLGLSVGLTPGDDTEASNGYAPTPGGFAPSPVSFALPPGASTAQGSDFRSYVKNAVNGLTAHLVDGLMRLTSAGNVELVPAGFSPLALITPAQSLYEQAHGSVLSPFVTPDWSIWSPVSTFSFVAEPIPSQPLKNAISTILTHLHTFVQRLVSLLP